MGPRPRWVPLWLWGSLLLRADENGEGTKATLRVKVRVQDEVIELYQVLKPKPTRTGPVLSPVLSSDSHRGPMGLHGPP